MRDELIRRCCLSVALCLCACSTSLPQREMKLSTFVPREELLASGIWEDFSAKFPEECEWFELARVVDGDTVKLVDGTSVRFVGIDTPETVHPSKPVQRCGPEASGWTKEVFAGDERVCLIYDELSDERDKYDRRLAYPFTEEGVDTTAELLKLGLARGYFYFPFSRKDEFRSYHGKAKLEKVGVWSKKGEGMECEEIDYSK